MPGNIPNDLEFVQIFAARISHDLAGTLGAINSAIEFVQSDDTEVRKKALELMELSSVQANDRLRYMRYAYGISKYSGDADLETIRELCVLLEKDGNVKMNFQAPGKVTLDQTMDVGVGKLIVCIASMCKTNLFRGGSISVGWVEDKKNAIIITAEGEGIKEPKDLHEIMQGHNYIDVAITPQNVHAYYMQKLMEAQNVKLDIKATEGKIEYTINL